MANKNMLYLLITIIALVIVALLAAPKSQPVTAASPINGMMGGTTTEAEKEGHTTLPATNTTAAGKLAQPAPAPTNNVDVTNPATPAPVAVVPAAPTAPAGDDVPAGAEVNGDTAAPAPPAAGNFPSQGPTGVPAAATPANPTTPVQGQ